MDQARVSELTVRLAQTAPAERVALFDEIFVLLRKPVVAVCLKILRRSSDAEDAVQETFIAVYRTLRSFRGEASVSTWILRIAVRVALPAQAPLGPPSAL